MQPARTLTLTTPEGATIRFREPTAVTIMDILDGPAPDQHNAYKTLEALLQRHIPDHTDPDPASAGPIAIANFIDQLTYPQMLEAQREILAALLPDITPPANPPAPQSTSV